VSSNPTIVEGFRELIRLVGQSDQLGPIISSVYRAHLDGGLTDNEAEQLHKAAERRRGGLRTITPNTHKIGCVRTFASDSPRRLVAAVPAVRILRVPAWIRELSRCVQLICVIKATNRTR
jgi:hypothetical protein